MLVLTLFLDKYQIAVSLSHLIKRSLTTESHRSGVRISHVCASNVLLHLFDTGVVTGGLRWTRTMGSGLRSISVSHL